MPIRPVIRAVLFLVVASTLCVASLAAQVFTPMGQGCPPNPPEYCMPQPDWEVQVTPDATTESSRVPGTSGHTKAFTVRNFGDPDSFSLSCSSEGMVVCDSVRPVTMTLAEAATGTAAAYYSVGNPETGKLRVTASGMSNDDGWVWVPVVIPSTSPLVSLSPHSGGARDLAKCVASCFDKVFAHSTPSYTTLDVPRTFGLVYSSGQARPTPVVLLDVTRPASGAVVTSYKVELRRKDNGALLNLLNGQTSVYYLPQASGASRIAIALDAIANGIGTHFLEVKATVTANLSVGGPTSTTLLTRILPVDRSSTPYGTGVWPAGMAQVATPQGLNGPATVTEADGSVFFYLRRNNAYVIPGGTSARLTATTGLYFRRTFLDGSYQEFDWSTGMMTKAVDRFGVTSRFYWTGVKLDSLVDPVGMKIGVLYNASGKLLSATDPGLRVTTYSVNGSNHLATITDPDGVASSLAYDSNGLLTSMTGRGGAVSKVAYDELRRVKADSAPSVALFDGTSARPTVAYAAAERVVWQPSLAGTSGAPKAAIGADTARATITDPLGAVTRFQLDRFGSPLKVIDVLGKTTQFYRDTMSRVISVITPAGHVTGVTYNGSIGGNQYNIYLVNDVHDQATGRRVTWFYNNKNDVTRITGAGPTQDLVYYNGESGGPIGALKQVKVGGSTTPSVTYTYNTRGQRVTATDASGHATTWNYSTIHGNSYYMRDPRGNVTTQLFDALGRVDTTMAPDGTRTGAGYGVLNQVLQTRNQLGYLTTTQYNPDLSVKRIVDPKGQVYKFSYNTLGWLTARHDLADSTKADSTWYDRAGQPRRTKTRRGNVLGAAYDVAGRLTLQTYRRPGATVDTAYAWFAYDSVGRRMQASNWSQADSLALDVNGRVTAWSLRQGAEEFRFAYQYDVQDRLIMRSLTLNGAAVNDAYLSRSYDSYGQFTQTTAAGVMVRFDRTTADSLPTKRVINPGQSGSWWFGQLLDANHQPTRDSMSVQALDESFGGELTFDSLGRFTRSALPGFISGARRYRYDAAGRLVNSCFELTTDCYGEYNTTSYASAPYSYDAAGNRNDAGAGAVVLTGNRTSQFKGFTLTYDADGNVISKVGNGKSWTYTWDPYNKLTEVRESSVLKAKFVYDAFGRRIATCSNISCSAGERHVPDGDQLVVVRSASGPISEIYGWYPGVDQPMSVKAAGRTGVFITDPQLDATVLGVADAAGGAGIKNYTSGVVPPTVWGETATDTVGTPRLRMAGQQFDPQTGLYYMRARFYDPQLGRFMSEDPIGIAGGMNLYAYASNDPVNSWDPSGLGPDGPCHVDLRCPAIPLPDIMVDNSQPPLAPDYMTPIGYPPLPPFRGGDYPVSPGGYVQNGEHRMRGRPLPERRAPGPDPCGGWQLAMAGGVAADIGQLAGYGAGVRLIARGVAMMFRGGTTTLTAARTAVAATSMTALYGQVAAASRGVTMISNGANLTAAGGTLVAADVLAVGRPSQAPTSFNPLDLSLTVQAIQGHSACRRNQ